MQKFQKALETITKQHIDGLLPGVIAIGAASPRDTEPQILLYVKSKKTVVPKEVEGFPVSTIVVKNVKPNEILRIYQPTAES
jgi:hypothetical protein